MKRNKKGFTLIELLAVIVILAIIALIAVPVVLDLMKDVRRQSFLATARGLIKAGDFYYSSQEMKGEELEDTIFQFPANIEGLEFSGTVPKSGSMVVTDDGDIALAISNGKLCAIKGRNDRDITITKDEGNCDFPYTLRALATTSEELEIENVAECLDNGETCDAGTPFAIKVNDKDTYKFYVIADDGDTVTLIMSSNLYEKGNTIEPDVPWISKLDYNDDINYGADGNNNKGPITAINALDERTKDWDYIMAKSYTYSGIGHDGKTRVYEDIIRTMKARMITYDEANDIKTANNGTMPGWMYENLYFNSTSGYWTSTAAASESIRAGIVDYFGALYNYRVNIGYYSGVRPVIEIFKQY